LHPGHFSTFVDTFSVDSSEIQQILGLRAPDFRMRDAELVIRYFAFRNYLSNYKGNLAPLFDLATNNLNKKWTADEATVRSQAEDLTEAIRATLEIFGPNAFRKWNGISYERALNRAIFDVMVLFFDKVEIRQTAIQRRHEVESALKSLCERDQEFR